MYEFKLAWRNLLNRPVQPLVTIIVIALAVALAVAVTHLNDGLQRGIIRASDPFGVLVVGAKGSGQQLVLSTLLLQGTPVGNIDGHIFTELSSDPRVTLAVPLALGDNVGGARIIGTDQSFFELRPSLQGSSSFQLAEGRLFSANYEAVLGSQAAAELGLHIGDQFQPAHGVERGLEKDHHAEVHTVVSTLTVLAINMREQPEAVAAFAAELGVDLPILLDPDDATLLAYGVRGLPMSFLIAPDGALVQRISGVVQPDNLAVIAAP